MLVCLGGDTVSVVLSSPALLGESGTGSGSGFGLKIILGLASSLCSVRDLGVVTLVNLRLSSSSV